MFKLRVSAPLYLIESFDTCWNCKRGTRVIAFAVSGVEDDENRTKFDNFAKLSYIEELPQKLVTFVEQN